MLTLLTLKQPHVNSVRINKKTMMVTDTEYACTQY